MEFDYSTLESETFTAQEESVPNGKSEYISPHDLNEDDLVSETPDLPDASITNAPKRSRLAKQYETKVGEFLGGIAKETLGHPSTVADGAALLYYSKGVATAWGDLAVADKRVRAGLDFVIGGTGNPYSAAVFATVPLVLQIIRNHEHEAVAETPIRTWRVPFIKRKIEIPLKLHLRVGGRARAMFTHDPDELTAAALTPSIRQQLEANGVKIARRKRNKRD